MCSTTCVSYLVGNLKLKNISPASVHVLEGAEEGSDCQRGVNVTLPCLDGAITCAEVTRPCQLSGNESALLVLQLAFSAKM